MSCLFLPFLFVTHQNKLISFCCWRYQTPLLQGTEKSSWSELEASSLIASFVKGEKCYAGSWGERELSIVLASCKSYTLTQGMPGKIYLLLQDWRYCEDNQWQWPSDWILCLLLWREFMSGNINLIKNPWLRQSWALCNNLVLLFIFTFLLSYSMTVFI